MYNFWLASGFSTTRLHNLSRIDESSGPSVATASSPFMRQYVYMKFRAEGWKGQSGPPPTPAYFMRIWKLYFDNIKLKKAMRFTLCDTCVTAGAALDNQRANGGPAWKTSEMDVIIRGLRDHHEVWRHLKYTRMDSAMMCIAGEQHMG